MTLDKRTQVVLETKELLGQDIIVKFERVDYDQWGNPQKIRVGIEAPRHVGIGRIKDGVRTKPQEEKGG